MNYPGRIRINLLFCRRPAVDDKEVEKYFHGISGIRKVSFNRRTQNLLIEYDGSPTTMDVIFSCIRLMPQNIPLMQKDDRAAFLSDSLIIVAWYPALFYG
jgi:hypothetical protein|tara:strand:- start:339 stop:638 length:300 start_codon:yes stop_codon:yes gene_type:complete